MGSGGVGMRQSRTVDRALSNAPAEAHSRFARFEIGESVRTRRSSSGLARSTLLLLLAAILAAIVVALFTLGRGAVEQSDARPRSQARPIAETSSPSPTPLDQAPTRS